MDCGEPRRLPCDMLARMEVSCIACGAPIPAEDVKLAPGITRCRTCATEPGGVPAQMRVITDQRQVAGYRRAAGAGRGDLVIQRRWLSPRRLALTSLACLVSGGFTLYLARLLADRLADIGPDNPLELHDLGYFLYPALAAFLTYGLLAAIFNATLVGVRGGDVFVRHGPLPWPGNLTLSARAIVQLFCEARVIRFGNGERRIYQLTAVLRDGLRVPLAPDLSTLEQARFLELALEERLEIVPAAVEGEITGFDPG